VALSVPAIGVTEPLELLGVNLDGTVQVPTDIQKPGWYQFGPTPGQAGSAVILGHVDSYRGPAVFFKLRTLVAGDLIGVTMANGSTAQFKVTSVAMYLKTQFPTQQVYASGGASSLQLVTCGECSTLIRVIIFPTSWCIRRWLPPPRHDPRVSVGRKRRHARPLSAISRCRECAQPQSWRAARDIASFQPRCLEIP